MTSKITAEEIFQEFAATLILQVFGGGGAIWGFSEVCGLRVPETVHFWQPTAALVGFLFWLRWLRQLYARITMCPSQTNSPSTEYWIRTGGSGHWDCCQIYSAKLVLEVFGAGGAIWGFSEVTGLRVPENKHVWQPTAAAVGFIFFLRWLRQLHTQLKSLSSPYEQTTTKLSTSMSGLSMREDTTTTETTSLTSSDSSHDIA